MSAHSTTELFDEEAWAERLPPALRKATGAWFTPAWLVEEVLDACAPFLPPRFCAVDPASGGGGFLAAVNARWPRAELRGLEVNAAAAQECRARVPQAKVVEGDALGEGWARLARSIPEGPELWVGNPPYNGRSAALDDKATFERLQALVSKPLPKGTSLRDDYAYFLLQAAHRLSGREGVLAFVTSASLLDAFLYGPVREELLSRLELRAVRELPAGTFRGTKVKTCFTVWTSTKARAVSPLHRAVLAEPNFRLRLPSAEAAALDRKWRAEGVALETLVPVTFPGLKTRFDELLVDDDRDRLLERMRALSNAKDLRAFAERWEIPESCWKKLSALPRGFEVNPKNVRPFHHWRGAGFESSWCYLDRALIPRGDHRFRGDFDPHLGEAKLVFNAHELPLAAAVLDRPGCVPAWRHTRFAPLRVPRRLRAEGLGVAAQLTASERADLVPNLSIEREPRAAFDRIAAFINSEPVQKVWAPAFGAAGSLHVPLRQLVLPDRQQVRRDRVTQRRGEEDSDQAG
ncbi:MAG: N-6 DNA methylase [Myxococcaceae bacterium]